MKTPIRTRLILAVVVDPVTECWLWQKSRNDQGYGQLHFDGALRSAHIVSYQVFVGPVPDGLTLDHTCRNTSCINPDHLEPVTMRENILRGTCPAANQARQTHCKRGHPLFGANLYLEKNGRRRCRACMRTRTPAPLEHANTPPFELATT